VLSATPDATDLVMAENDFNDPPQPGNQFYVVEVSATYVGNESEELAGGVTFGAVGARSVAYDFASTCWVIPDPIDEYAEVFPGGAVRGNLCWEVDSLDADSLLLIANPSFILGEERLFMAMPPEGTSFDPPPSTPAELNVTTTAGIGDPVLAGDWELSVLSVTPDATDAVMAENQFNDPPQPGNQFYVVELSATYVGNRSEAFALGPSITAVGNSAVAYGYNATCGVIPDPIDEFSDVFPGGTVFGNVCWEIATDDVDSLVLIVDPVFSLDQERTFIDLS